MTENTDSAGQMFSLPALTHPLSLGPCWRDISPLHKTVLCSGFHKLCWGPIPSHHCLSIYSFFPNSTEKHLCWRLNQHLLACPMWTWRRASSIYWKAAVTLFLSSLSRLNRTNSLGLSSCSVFSIPRTILVLLIWTLSSLSLSFLKCGAQNRTKYSSWVSPVPTE